MSQKSVIVVIPISEGKFIQTGTTDFQGRDEPIGRIDTQLYQNKYLYTFTDLKTLCKMWKWNYNTISRKGDCFVYDGFQVIRSKIIRLGGQEKRKEKD